MGLVIGIVGIGLLTWALGAGLFTNEAGRAKIFSGYVGQLLTGVVIAFALFLIWFAFFRPH